MDQSSSNSPIHQLDYSNGGSSPLSNQSFNIVNAIKTSTNMQTNGSSSLTSLDTNHLNKHSEAPKRLCLVCGDIASGFHYGVSSCEACKAFFKRTIQGNIEYSCPAQGDCEINKRRRKACQACRFQKCLKMGMLKEGVRLDRVRGGRQKYRRSNGETPYLVNGLNCNNSTANGNSAYFNVLNNMRTGQQNPLISVLLNCEPEPNSVGNSNEMLNSEIDCKPFSGSGVSNRLISILSELVDKELVSTIIWAKNIPGFQDLELNDQMRLLQSTWAEILALSIAYRTQQTFNSNSSTPNTPTTPCNSISISNGNSKVNLIIPNRLVFASDFIMEQSHALECGADDIFTNFIHLLRRLIPLSISKQEYVLLKALLLFNVYIELEDCESVEKLRNNVLSALQEVIAHGKQPVNAFQHLNELLLSLPLIRQVDFVIRKFWNQVRSDNKVPMNKLFVEMLESSYKSNIY